MWWDRGEGRMGWDELAGAVHCDSSAGLAGAECCGPAAAVKGGGQS